MGVIAHVHRISGVDLARWSPSFTELTQKCTQKKRISLRNVQIMIAKVSSGEKRLISSFFGYHREPRRIGRLKKFTRKPVEK